MGFSSLFFLVPVLRVPHVAKKVYIHTYMYTSINLVLCIVVYCVLCTRGTHPGTDAKSKMKKNWNTLMLDGHTSHTTTNTTSTAGTPGVYTYLCDCVYTPGWKLRRS